MSGTFQRDALTPNSIPTEEKQNNALKVLLCIRDDVIGQNNNHRFLQKEKVKKYLKYLLSILATEVLEFFTAEVQNHRDETERWFLKNFTDDQLRIYKTSINNLQFLSSQE